MWIDVIALRACLLRGGTFRGRLLVECGAELLLVQRGLRGVGEGGEGGGIADGDVSQDFPVDERTGGLEAGDQLRIGDSVQAGGGIDAGDPQRAEITFAIFAAGERGVQALLDLLLRDPVTARLHSPVALGELQDLRAAVLSFWTSFDSRHLVSSFESF